jgi:hypothetical protein
MSARAILILGALTLVALTLALLLARPAAEPSAQENEPLIPGLRALVNDIDEIEIVSSDGSPLVKLRRERERWRVQERDGYEADFERVHELLRTLASAQRASPRTANPDWYARLGVVEPGQPEASGMMVRFPGTALPGLIVGNPDNAGQGHFVRLATEEKSWVSDQPVELPERLIDWLERSVMDIPARELSEVTIRHPDGDTVELKAADEEGEQWVLMNVPDGREALEYWQLRPVAGGLSSIRLEDVARVEGIPQDAVRALYVTRDGLNFVASLFADEAGGWVHFSVSAEVAAADNGELDEVSQALIIDAAAVDERLSPWRFRLASRKYETMTRRLEDLLRARAE